MTEAPEMTAGELLALGGKWRDRLKAAETREEKWRAQAAAAEKAYLADSEAEHGKCYDFNILHSNVETIVPAIFNSSPQPDIRERFRVGNETPESTLARMVAQVFERAISVQVDDGALVQEMEAETQDAFVAGRGILRLRFDADEGVDPMGQPMVTNERIQFETVSWRDYREGPAMRWRDVPWVAYRHCISAEEADRITDPDLKAKLGAGEGAEARPILAHDGEGDVHVWEIWCKATGKVYMMADASDAILSIQDDPLGLPGFFPQPMPLQPITGVGKRCPVAPFTIYRALAEELETITKRINALVKMMKAKGAIIGNAEAMERLAQAGDGDLTVLDNMEGVLAQGGLDKAIMWWPIDAISAVIDRLYIAREQTKAMIYEVTGISDIIRGDSAASETATAQQIKTQWGSLRIKRMQRMIERQVREVFVICAEIMSRHFAPQSLMAMTGIQLPPEAMAMLQKPLDHYRIDVESDSTVRADLTGRREEMARFLEGSAQFFGAMAPVVQSAPGAAGPVAEIYAAFARQFALGKQAEDAIENMAEMAREMAKNPPPSAEEQAAEREAQVQQQAAAMEAEKLTLERDKLQADVAMKQMDMEMKRMELVLAERQAEIDGLRTVAELQNADDDRDMQREAIKEPADG